MAKEQTSVHRKITFGNLVQRFILLTIGAVLMAYSLESLLIPNDIVDGGVTGVSMLLDHVTPFGLSIFLVILNLPFFFLGYKQIGKTFAFSMLYGIVALSVATIFMHDLKPVTNEHLLAIVFGGVLLGAGVGLAMRGGGCLDGTESLAILIEKKTPFSVGDIIMVINVIIFSVAALVFGIESALSSMLTYYIASKTIDIVVRGFDDMKSMHIISNDIEEIVEAISSRLGRGVTYLHGEGSYSGEDKKVALAVFSRLEETKMKDIIKSIDPQAFVIITDVAEVKGGRFKKRDIH